MKQTIRLTESQFKKVITETIKKVLREEDKINSELDFTKDPIFRSHLISTLNDLKKQGSLCFLLNLANRWADEYKYGDFEEYKELIEEEFRIFDEIVIQENPFTVSFNDYSFDSSLRINLGYKNGYLTANINGYHPLIIKNCK